ncbi:type I phosphodiesterase/nucleotide pyrophosphatase, partial [Natrinema altunense JCM 12890]
IAPTLLHGIGEPVPDNADGRVLFDAFDDESTPAATKVERTTVDRIESDEAVEEDFDDVADRLKGLGYME